MLAKGTIITAKLIEAIEENRWIVSFQGELLQVQNNTPIQFKENLNLRLQVIKEKPLALKVLCEQRSKRSKLDLHV